MPTFLFEMNFNSILDLGLLSYHVHVQYGLKIKRLLWSNKIQYTCNACTVHVQYKH